MKFRIFLFNLLKTMTIGTNRFMKNPWKLNSSVVVKIINLAFNFNIGFENPTIKWKLILLKLFTSLSD